MGYSDKNEQTEEFTDLHTRRVSGESTGDSEVKRRSKRGKRKTAEVEVAAVSQLEAGGARAILSVTPGKYILPVPSGAVYVWSGPGSIVSVAAEDVEDVMAKNGNGARECCGAGKSRIYFQLLEE